MFQCFFIWFWLCRPFCIPGTLSTSNEQKQVFAELLSAQHLVASHQIADWRSEAFLQKQLLCDNPYKKKYMVWIHMKQFTQCPHIYGCEEWVTFLCWIQFWFAWFHTSKSSGNPHACINKTQAMALWRQGADNTHAHDAETKQIATSTPLANVSALASLDCFLYIVRHFFTKILQWCVCIYIYVYIFNTKIAPIPSRVYLDPYSIKL